MRLWFALAGALCLAGGLWLAVRRLRVRLFGLQACGTVVGHEAREVDDSKSYFPVVMFRDRGGVEFRFTAMAGGASRSPEIGAGLPVRYLPSDPRLAYVDNFLHMWAAPLAALTLGAAGIAVLWLP